MSIKETKYAIESLNMLIQHIFQSANALRAIPYSDLAQRIGRLTKYGYGHGHGMGHVLGEMGHLLQNLEGEWGEPIPHIQSLVVNKTGKLKGLPDDGIKEFWKDYPKLTIEEKRNKVHAEYKKIKEYGSRWNKVLSALGLPPVKAESKSITSNKPPYGTGGESPQHLALKEYVKNHPQLAGANIIDDVFLEYSLPSLDEIDVLFKSPSRWTAVEVKSKISDLFTQDYERGLYQCVKYGAILDAMTKDLKYQTPETIDVYFVLESKLPDQYRSLSKILGINLIENIKLPDFG